ncbi:hypothetical protein LCGC14_1879050 [marine sediment metagenome]|uniref:Uncharacterized protein n=1 Tax=marine sediment metagenome TaxID=412755 RepID=A0A0F9G2U9_9ZZZZ
MYECKKKIKIKKKERLHQAFPVVNREEYEKIRKEGSSLDKLHEMGYEKYSKYLNRFGIMILKPETCSYCGGVLDKGVDICELCESEKK